MEYPKYIQLQSPAFLSPKLFNATNEIGIVEDEFTIAICGEKLKSKEPLIVGEQFYFRIGTYYPEMVYKREVDAYNEYYAKEKEKSLAKIEERELRHIEERQNRTLFFWAKYNIPFKFSIEIKECLSGLSENSRGNGTKKNSVTHIYTLESIGFGKLKRAKHEFLCSKVKAHTGGNWSWTLGEHAGIKGNQVTCKQCLKLMEKWKKE